MKAPNMFGANAYAKVGLESGVNSASPHGLILMLYDGAVQAIKQAMMYMAQDLSEQKGLAISKALRIIDEGLKAALDIKAGGELGEQLFLLYDYIGKELILSSAQKNAERMQNCILLLEDLRSAWADIGQTQPAREAYSA